MTLIARLTLVIQAIGADIKSLFSGKQDLNLTMRTNTASYTAVLGDNGRTIIQNVGASNSVTIPQNSSVAFPIGCTLPIVQIGAGQTTIVAGTGTTINSASGLKLRARYSMAFVHKIDTNTWIAGGDLTT